MHEALDHVGAALLVGGARALGQRLAGQVLAGEHALRDRATRRSGEMPSSSQVGTTSSSMTRQSMEYCGWFEMSWKPSSLAQRVARADLVGGPLADADVERLALADDVGERLHRLLERRLGVVAVRLVEVDVVGLQPLQRAVDRLHDVLAGQAGVVLAARARSASRPS